MMWYSIIFMLYYNEIADICTVGFVKVCTVNLLSAKFKTAEF
jgi:hypothetical protein